MLVIIANRDELDQADLGQSCLYQPFFGRLVFEILEYLPKSHFIIHSITSNMETIENTMSFFFTTDLTIPYRNERITVKPVLSSHSKRRPKIGFQDLSSLMQVRSIAECILEYF